MRRDLQLLPEIKGPVKSIKQLLMADLEADGVIRNNIPFSSRRRNTGAQAAQSARNLS
jgi:hypothetical protein